MKRMKVFELLSSAFLIFVMLISTAFENMQAQNIESLESKIAHSSPQEAAHLKSLTTDLLTSIFINQGQVTTHGNGSPTVLYIDAASINLLYESNPLFSGVEMIRMKFNAPSDLPASIMIDQIQGFDNLKYTYFLFAYDVCSNQSEICLQSIVEEILNQSETLGTSTGLKASPPISILYNLSILE